MGGYHTSSWQGAAALSAAVTTTRLSETRHPSGGTNSAQTAPAKRQPLFGREREGGASLREAASLAYSSPGKFAFPLVVHLTMRGFEGIL